MILIAWLLAFTQVHDDFTLSLSVRDAQAWCTISADRADARELVDALALKLGLDVEGLQSIPAGARVSVELRERTANQTLARILGSLGLVGEMRTRTLFVRPLAAAGLQREDLLELAMASYLRALRDFPDHPIGALARLAQARIEVARGFPDAALTHYEALIQRNKGAEVAPDALLECGDLLMRQREWATAAQRFEDLLKLDRRHPYEIRARLSVARCAAQLGDHERALYMLDVIDTYAPTSEPAEIQDRLALRARALIAARCAEDARDALASAEKLSRRGDAPVELLELRARLLALDGDAASACRAWLEFARRADDIDTSVAYAQAARLASEAGDELAALFIAETATKHGAGDQVRAVKSRAEEELALAERDPRTADAEERLARAERLVAAGLYAEARPLLALLMAESEPLVPDLTLRIALAHATALDRTAGVDAALAVLRDALPELTDADARRKVYVRAGEILEDHGYLDRAVEAYQGRF